MLHEAKINIPHTFLVSHVYLILPYIHTPRISMHTHSFAPIVQDIAVFLPYIVPVLVARLSTQEITEPSEELRLSLVSLLSSFIDLCSSNMAPYLSDTVSILQRTIVDPYPEVKKVREHMEPPFVLYKVFLCRRKCGSRIMATTVSLRSVFYLNTTLAACG